MYILVSLPYTSTIYLFVCLSVWVFIGMITAKNNSEPGMIIMIGKEERMFGMDGWLNKWMMLLIWPCCWPWSLLTNCIFISLPFLYKFSLFSHSLSYQAKETYCNRVDCVTPASKSILTCPKPIWQNIIDEFSFFL